MKCVNCGNDLEEGTLFCPSCGSKVEVQSAEMPAPNEQPVPAMGQPVYYQPGGYPYGMPPKKNTGLKVVIIILTIIILVGIGLGLWLFVFKDKGDSNNNSSNNSNNTVVDNTNTGNDIGNNTGNNTSGGGNSSKKLECSISQVQSTGLGDGFNIDMNGDVGIAFSDGIPSGMKMSFVLTLQEKLYQSLQEEGDIDSQMQLLADEFEKGFEEGFSSNGGMEDAITSKDISYSANKIYVNIEFDLSDIEDNVTSRDDIKSYFESQGFNCN